MERELNVKCNIDTSPLIKALEDIHITLIKHKYRGYNSNNNRKYSGKKPLRFKAIRKHANKKNKRLNKIFQKSSVERVISERLKKGNEEMIDNIEIRCKS